MNNPRFDLCTGYGAHYRICDKYPDAVYAPPWTPHECGYHTWFGNSKALHHVGSCPRFDGNYSHGIDPCKPEPFPVPV